MKKINPKNKTIEVEVFINDSPKIEDMPKIVVDKITSYIESLIKKEEN